MPRPLCLLLAACSLHLVASDDPYLVQGRALPRVLDLAGADIGRLLPKDARDPAQVESARRAWEPLAAQSRGAGSLRLRLPRDERRLPLLLAASQALKAADPGLKLYLCFEAGAPGLWEETAWGALEGGILAPEDLEGTPEAWRTRLAQAQEQLPGRPWTLFLPRDPGASLGALLGDGGRLVVPEGGPAAALAAQLPAGLRDVEGGMGDLTLRARTAGEARRWTFQQGTWKPVPLPKERNEVAVTSKAIYDVGALLSRMRATQLRDRAALRSTEAEVKVDLHFQGERGGGDLGFTFRAFEAGGEPEELLRKEVRLNGVSAKLHGDVPLPLVEARSAAATPVSLALTERYRYEDDGEAGPGLRRLKFRPVDKDPLLYSGTLVVEEATGRIREERTERSDLPGIVRSELRTLIYGEPAPGFWRVVSMTTHERWLGTGGVGQIQRTIRYADWKVNDPGFETAREAARASDGSILRQTVEGLRYFVKGKDGVRRIEERTRTSGRAVGGVLVVRPGQEPPVFPGVGVVLFDFDAFGKGIQYNLFSALGVVNFGSIGIPKAFLGLDFHARGMVNLLKATERPARDGQVLDREGVGRRTQNLEVGVGRDLGAGFRGELEGTFTLDQYSQGDDKYRTQGFKLPESGITRLANAQLSWQRRQFTLKGFYGVGQRPAGRWGMEGSQQVPDEGRFARWGGYAGYDLGLEGGLRGFTGLGWASGRGFDRFSPLDFNGRVSGIDDSAVSADRMVYGTVGCHVPTGPKLRLTAALEHGRARHMVDQKTYGFTGLRLAGDLPGFWWFTTVRLDIGAGLQSDIKGGKAVNGMVSVLRLF